MSQSNAASRTAEADAIRRHVDGGDANGALSRLGRVLADGVAAEVALDRDRTLTPAYLLAPDHMRGGRLDELWYWLWDVLQSRPALAKIVVPDLAPVVLDPALPVHLRLKAYVAGGFWRRPERFAELCRAIREEPNLAAAHAAFQQLMMRAAQSLVGEDAALWPEAAATHDALVRHAAELAPAAGRGDHAARRARVEADGIRRIAIVTDRMSDTRWHGPTRAVTNYTNLLQAAGVEVVVFETRERSPSSDERPFVESPLDWPAYRPGDIKPFTAEIRAPADHSRRAAMIAGSIADIAAFDPDVILRMGAERSLPAAARLWDVPVIAVALNAVYPANLGCDAVFMKGATPALRDLYKAAGETLPRLVEHRYFVPHPTLENPTPGPDRLAEIRDRLGLAAGERAVVTVGHDTAAYCDAPFVETMRGVLDRVPDAVWLIAGRTLPEPVAALEREGYAIRHVERLHPFAEDIHAAGALAVPFRQVGGAGAQYRAAHAGCPVLIQENPLSDGYRLFWRETAVPDRAAYAERLAAVLSDDAAREAQVAAQRETLIAAYPAKLDDPAALRDAAEAVLAELMAEWRRLAAD